MHSRRSTWSSVCGPPTGDRRAGRHEGAPARRDRLVDLLARSGFSHPRHAEDVSHSHQGSDLNHSEIMRYPSATCENRPGSETGPTNSAVAQTSAHIRLGPTTVTEPVRSTKVPVTGS
jgi:hypothetical protein